MSPKQQTPFDFFRFGGGSVPNERRLACSVCGRTDLELMEYAGELFCRPDLKVRAARDQGNSIRFLLYAETCRAKAEELNRKEAR